MTTREAKLEQLVKEICENYDPVFGYISTSRLDDSDWMKRARKALGDEIFLKLFPWMKETGFRG